MRRTPVAAVAIAALAAATLALGAPASHGTQKWSGLWTTKFTNGLVGSIGFRHVSDAEGRAALVDLGGTPCTEPTDYFRGGYVSGNDNGKQTGCTVGGASHLVSRYSSDTGQPGGSLDMRLTSPTHWNGSYRTDAGTTGSYQGDFNGHFAGDGANAASTGDGTGGKCGKVTTLVSISQAGFPDGETGVLSKTKTGGTTHLSGNAICSGVFSHTNLRDPTTGADDRHIDLKPTAAELAASGKDLTIHVKVFRSTTKGCPIGTEGTLVLHDGPTNNTDTLRIRVCSHRHVYTGGNNKGLVVEITARK